MISSENRVAITALYGAYNRAIDSGDAVAWAETFIAGGLFRHPARDWHGTNELRAFVTGRASSLEAGPLTDVRHWNDALVIDDHGDDQGVSANCDLVVTGRRRDDNSPAIAAFGKYNDRLIRHEGGWRFVERVLTLA